MTTGSVRIEFRVHVPDLTPRATAIFVAGSAAALGHWKPDGLMLEPRGEGCFGLSVELPARRIVEFKITRGSWETVETAADGGECDNRRMLPDPASPLVEIRVDGWRDLAPVPPPPEAIEGRVSRLEVPSRALGGARRVWVYEPPPSAGRGPFPLLVCLDGQNKFAHGRDRDSTPVTWAVDLAADRLIREGRMAPIVMAAVANGKQRAHEYTPWPFWRKEVGGEARRTLTAIRDDVIPAVSDHWSILSGPPATGILGSSLAGLFSLWAVLQEPAVFSRAGIVSGAFFWGPKLLAEYLRSRTIGRGARLWLDVGSQELIGSKRVDARMYVTLVRMARDELERLGLPPGAELRYEEFEGAAHHERDWAARVDRILPFLYPPGG